MITRSLTLSEALGDSISLTHETRHIKIDTNHQKLTDSGFKIKSSYAIGKHIYWTLNNVPMSIHYLELKVLSIDYSRAGINSQ